MRIYVAIPALSLGGILSNVNPAERRSEVDEEGASIEYAL